jgi:hypothetical protein
MTTERFANKAITTLNGGIDGVVTSLVVNDPSKFPTLPQFRILVESELMLVTGVSGSTFTVQRGSEGTTNVSHANGVTVTHILTSGALDSLRNASGLQSATTIVLISSAPAPSPGQVLTATSSTDADWETPAPSSTLVTMAVDIDLTTTGNYLIDTRPSTPTGPGRWKLMSIDLRVKVAVTGSSTPSSTVSIGSTSGGQQIIINQVILPAATVGSIVGGFALNTLGSDMGQSTGFEAVYPAGQLIYANVTVSGTVATGTATAYLLWQGLP